MAPAQTFRGFREAQGADSANLSISDNGGGSPQHLSLCGSGTVVVKPPAAGVEGLVTLYAGITAVAVTRLRLAHS